VIVKNLEEFARREGWCPVYHDLKQVEEFKDYVTKITTKEFNSRNVYITFNREITAKRATEIKRWVENEQVLCMFDSNYFESRYCFVCDEAGEIFKFKNRKSQEVFDNVIAEFDEQRVSIELLILKARQLGITTKTALKFLHRLLFIPNTQAVMGSVKDEKSQLISRIIETCIERLPFWLPPRRVTDTKRLIDFVNGSVLSIQSGSQATGIAQGWTPTLVHLSEIGDIPNPKKTIEEGLLNATHSSSKLFLVLEGTGNGNTGWQADKWRSAKENWPLGKSRLFPFFVNWPMAPDLYPQPDWLRKCPVPGGWQPCEATRKHIQRCELFIRNTPYLAKVAGRDWRMPVHQQWFWEFRYLEHVATHTQKVWFSQMPADDYEALQGKNDLVFDSIVIETAQEKRVKKYQSYAIIGDSVDDGFDPEPNEIDYDKERIRVSWNSKRNQHFEWTMIPLLPLDSQAEMDEKKSMGRVLVFEEPNKVPGHYDEPQDYSIGIDTADGLGTEDSDRSVISVTRSMRDAQPDIQVCELADNRMSGPQTVAFAACLAAWYGAKNIDHRGVKFAIEQRDRPGDDCQLQLKLMGFNYHHVDQRYDDKKVKESTKGLKEGIYMHGWFRPMLMQRFTDAVSGGWYEPQSPFLIKELQDLELKVKAGGKNRMEHQSGKHDDRVLAAAHSYWTRHHFDILAERSQKKYAPPTQRLPELDFGYSSVAEVSVGEM